MKITFSRNHDGDTLVLVDGVVQAIAKDCEGWEKYGLDLAAPPVTGDSNAKLGVMAGGDQENLSTQGLAESGNAALLSAGAIAASCDGSGLQAQKAPPVTVEPVANRLTKDFIAAVILAICETPDRDSPEDFPEAMVVTPDELRNIFESVSEMFEEDSQPILAASIPASPDATDTGETK